VRHRFRAQPLVPVPGWWESNAPLQHPQGRVSSEQADIIVSSIQLLPSG
jgi:hypothetical protein